MIKRNIRLLELQEVGQSGLFFLPIMVLYFRDEIGLTYQDFLLTEAIFAATIILMEVPSGWLADIWQRRHSLFVASLFWVFGLYLLLIADGFLLAAASQSMIGVGYALRSGANTAMLYDTLAVENQVDQFMRLEGRRKGFSLYTAGLASLCGGFLYELDHALPLYAATAFSIVGLIASCFYVEPARARRATNKNALQDMLATVRYALRGHANVGLVIVLAAVLFSATKNINFVQQPYYIALEFPEYVFGLLLSVGLVLGGFASHINHRIGRHVSNVQLLALCWVVAILICGASALVIDIHGVVLLMFGGSFIYGIALPRAMDAINKRVGPERRATILSTASFGREVVFIPLSLIVGWMADVYGVSGALFALTLWLSITGVVLLIWARRSISNI